MHDTVHTVYDYVIVGAGSAGCVLAARLSEDPDTRVLLLEAGPPDDVPEIGVPAATPILWRGPFAWDDATMPQPHAGDRSVAWPHGRTLGGSSAINGMVYIRGNPVDYDTWRDAHGCAGWGYADLLPYFLRAEDQQRGESAFHGTGGPLRVEDPRFIHPLSRAWVEAAEASGLPGNDDFNAATQDGVGLYQLTQRHGRRWSTADAYLRPAMRRGNLTVETDALVTEVLIEDGRAVGVRYLRQGAERTARAHSEVLLCGGAVDSPKLLLLSGIGPAEHLREHGIEALVDAPRVGAGLQDHPVCLPEWRTPTTRNLWEEATPENLALWRREGRGPMASSGAEAGGFARTRQNLPAPDLQYGLLPGPAPDPDAVPPNRRALAMIVFAVDVKSRGRVALRSADARSKPLIDPAYLADESDLDVLVAGVRRAREIAACQPLAGLVAGESAPGEQVSDDERLRAWIRGSLGTAFHPTSTCAMGGAGEAVCDPELRYFARGQTVGGAERAAEVRRVGEPPASRDRAHRAVRQCRVQQITAAALEPAPPDPAGHALTLRLEQSVQVADRDEVGGGDHVGCQPGVLEPLLDEGVDAPQQGLLAARRLPVAAGPGRQRQGEQVDNGRTEPGAVCRPVRVELVGQLPGEPGGERTGPPSPAMRTPVSWASSSGGNGSSARGNITATARAAECAQRAGRDKSTRLRSPGPSLAWRPSCSTSRVPRATTSILHRSESDWRISFAVRAAWAGGAVISVTRTAATLPVRI